jgi:hypothetical protein
MPVDQKNPLFLGEPIFLGRTLNPKQEFTTSAWATEPTSFVACDGMAMYKWDLGNLSAAKTVASPETVFPLD